MLWAMAHERVYELLVHEMFLWTTFKHTLQHEITGPNWQSLPMV